MKTYNVYAKVVGTKYLGKVQAEDVDEATSLAEDLDDGFVSVCHQCSRQIEDPQIEEVYVEEE